MLWLSKGLRLQLSFQRDFHSKNAEFCKVEMIYFIQLCAPDSFYSDSVSSMLIFVNFTRFDKDFHIDLIAAEIYSIHFGPKENAASVIKDKIPENKSPPSCSQ